MQLLKAIIPIYFASQFLGVKDLGAAHLGGSGSESHHEVVVSSEGPPGAGGSAAYMGHVHGWPDDAGCWQKGPVAPHRGLSTCCFSVLMT